MKCGGSLSLNLATVHRRFITNRWGYIAAKTLLQLQKVLPEEHHVAIIKLLVPIGKHICTGALP
jgi:endonuclease-3